jgi:hypothetical protein
MTLWPILEVWFGDQQAERLSSVQLMERLTRVEEACDERSQHY